MPFLPRQNPGQIHYLAVHGRLVEPWRSHGTPEEYHFLQYRLGLPGAIAAAAEQRLESLDHHHHHHPWWSRTNDPRDSNIGRPDIPSFNAVWNAWARFRHPRVVARVEAILQHMKQRYISGNVTFPPDLLS